MQIDCFASSSSGNLYRVSNGVDPLLIECGLPIRKIKQALGYRLSDIRACLVSHSHADHSRAVRDLMKAGVDCYMSRETAEAHEICLNHRLIEVQPMKRFDIGSWSCKAFETQHDCPGSLGFLLASGRELLLYLTDSFYVRHRFRGLTHVMIEANWSKKTLSPDLDPAVKRRLIRSHMSLENVLKFLAANDLSAVREIILIHLSDGNSDAAMFKRAVERATGKPVRVAEDEE